MVDIRFDGEPDWRLKSTPSSSGVSWIHEDDDFGLMDYLKKNVVTSLLEPDPIDLVNKYFKNRGLCVMYDADEPKKGLLPVTLKAFQQRIDLCDLPDPCVLHFYIKQPSGCFKTKEK